MGVLMAVIFRSPYALMIGALGPVMALGSWWEARRTHRASEAQQLRQQQLEHERQRQKNAQAAEDYRREQLERFPAVHEWVTNPLWRPSGESPLRVRVGLASVRLPSPLDGERSTVHGVPLTLELGGGIAVVGQGQRARNCYRAIAIQSLALMVSDDAGGGPIPGGWDSLDPPENLTGVGEQGSTVQLVTHADDVDRSVRSVVTVSDQHAAVFVGGRLIDSHVIPDELSSPSALWAMRRLEQWAGEHNSQAVLHPDFHDRAALWGRVDQDHWHNIVADGPHGLIWGQSGRGKTLLLHSLLRDIAAHYPPERFSCVVIDFKGGAGVLAIDDLPHLAGVLTDLEPESVRRVQVGLRSEILRREHILASHRVSDLSDLPEEVTCPRTAIAIDEVALLLDSDPGWSALLGDIASRGRSLGLHLLVSGQRITSQVPRSVVANAGIRWCLGVTDPAEALDYLPGVSHTALQSLHQHPPGQVLGVVLGQPGYSVRVAQRGRLTSDDAGEGQAAPLWAPALPERVDGEGGLVGVLEDQQGQCLRPVGFEQFPPGMALVVGDSGSGRAGVVSRIAECAPRAVWLSDSPAECLDQLGALAEAIDEAESSPACIVAPRLDVLLQAISEAAEAALLNAVQRLARAADESAHTVVLVPSSPGVTALRRLRPAARSLVALSMCSVELWLELDLPRERWISRAPEDRGLWGEHAIQFAKPTGTAPREDLPSDAVARPTWRQVINQAGRLAIVGDDLPPEVSIEAGSSVAIMSVDEATLRRDRIDQALGADGVLLWGVGLAAARAIVGHERTPQLRAPEGTCWWVRPERLCLVSIGR